MTAQLIPTPDTAVAAPKGRGGGPRSVLAWLNPPLVVGAGLLLLIVIACYVARQFIDTSGVLIGSGRSDVVPIWISSPDSRLGFQPAESAHILGTDAQGRDMLASILVGTPRTLVVGALGASLAMFVGTLLGAVAGYRGGALDSVISTLTDVMLSIPGLLVLVVLASYLHGLEVISLALIIALFSWPLPTRMIRAQVLTMRERGYVLLARLSNASQISVIVREILPNLLSFIAAGFVRTMAAVILIATSIEALGLGPQRIPTLGTIIYNSLSSSAVFRGLWWWWLPPIIVLATIFGSLFLVMLGMDRILTPRMSR